MKNACVDSFDAIDCGAARTFCSTELEAPLMLSGKNPYDISRDCEGELMDTLCYPITKLATSAYRYNSIAEHFLGQL